MNHTKN